MHDYCNSRSVGDVRSSVKPTPFLSVCSDQKESLWRQAVELYERQRQIKLKLTRFRATNRKVKYSANL